MKWLLGITMGTALFVAVGCGQNSGETGGAGGGSTTSSGGASPCEDPQSGPVPESCGIWVSASLGKDANPGTQDAPVASLSHALELAGDATGHVYACAETWSEPIKLYGGMGLHGGFDCEDGWAYRGKDKRSILATGPDEIPLIVTGDGSGAKAILSDFIVEAADAATPSGSSIGILVREASPLWIYRCEIVAGNGADGLPGAPDGTPGTDGAPGGIGADACSATVSKGGISPEMACALGGMTKGGAGGDGALLTAGDGGPGGPLTGDPQDGAGGLGQTGLQTCTDGSPGATGAEGAFGFGGCAETLCLGHITNEGFVGVPGEDGKPGAPGQGGGGGGGTLGSNAVCGAATPGGASGGSGGTGGCGGKGGAGGQPGGASVAVALRNSIALFESRLVAGEAGRGGDGAPGQPGGDGGPGGVGGTGKGTIQPACAGGAGGRGGNGGWGGGGQGGSAAPVGYASFVQSWLIGGEGTSQFIVGKAGYGGLGDPVHADGIGQSGIKALVAEFDP